MIELKPCPLCGCNDVFFVNPDLPDPFSKVVLKKAEIICPRCGVGFCFGYYGTNENSEKVFIDAANKWNRRA